MELDLQKPDLRAFLRRSVGAVRESRFCGSEHAQSRVWRVTPEGNKPSVYLKLAQSKRKYAQELGFYRQWSRRLGDDVPYLLAHHDGLRALLLSEGPGRSCSELELGPKQRIRLYRKAGEVLRRLHDLPHQDRDIPLSAAFQMRLEAACRQAHELSEGRLAQQVRLRVESSLELLGGYRRVPCHRDFWERNWLWSENGEFRVIDFEHAKPDLFLVDFQKMAEPAWLDNPELETGFWEGYGRRLDEAEAQILRALLLLSCLGTVLWARRHEDSDFLERGRRGLERLLP